MATRIPCNDCGFEFPRHVQCCPHCGRPSLFPNVTDAEDLAEKAELDARYEGAMNDLNSRGCKGVAVRFEEAVNTTSQAVIGRPFAEVQRLANADSELYATYYDLISAGVRIPAGDKWDRLRQSAEPAVLHGYHETVHFAALSLENTGLLNYGECFLVVRDDMIEYRASVFEENCVLFMEHQGILASELDSIPKGYRATWQNRGVLCIAKLFWDIHPDTQEEDFTDILLKNGMTSADDGFVEVHICGPMTIRTVKHVTVIRKGNRPRKILLKDLESQLDSIGVALEIK